MDELMKKYAKILLNVCLKIEKNQPLFISYNAERTDFVRILAEEAFNIGIKDIYLDSTDPYLKHEALLHLEVNELKKLTFWNKEIWNVYAKKNAAFLMLASETPGLMKDVDQKKLKEMTKYSYKTRREFDDLRDKSKIAWTIAAVPTREWAQTIYPNSLDPVSDLWNKIFDICHIKEDNPQKYWEKKLEKLQNRAKRLTERQFKKLVYENSLGTSFSIELPENHIWQSGYETLDNKKKVLVNFPTEEVFTSPTYDSAEGIVYASFPLAYQDVIINNFSIRFEKGKVVEFHAEEGEETLNNMIHICENSDRLGEVALVPFDSPISNANQIFLETLYDENASCHIALGDSFPECIEKGTKIKKEELYNKYHLNKSESHIDFMIGTKDLKITGITKTEEEVPIFISGNFSIEFD